MAKLRWPFCHETIELEYPERLCYYVHGVRIENTPLPCLPAQANRAGQKTNAAPKVSYEISVSPISMHETSIINKTKTFDCDLILTAKKIKFCLKFIEN